MRTKGGGTNKQCLYILPEVLDTEKKRVPKKNMKKILGRKKCAF